MKKSRRYFSLLPIERCEEIWEKADFSDLGGRNYCIISKTKPNRQKKLKIHTLGRYSYRSQYKPWRLGAARTFYLTFDNEVRVHTPIPPSTIYLYILLLMWCSLWLPLIILSAPLIYKMIGICMILAGVIYLHFFKVQELKRFGLQLLDQFIRQELRGLPLKEPSFVQDSASILLEGNTLMIQNSSRYRKKLLAVVILVSALIATLLLGIFAFPFQSISGEILLPEGLGFGGLYLPIIVSLYLLELIWLIRRKNYTLLVDPRGITFNTFFIPWSQAKYIGFWDENLRVVYGNGGDSFTNYIEGIAILADDNFQPITRVPSRLRCLNSFRDSTTPLWQNVRREFCLAIPPEIRAKQALEAIYSYMDEHNIVLPGEQSPYQEWSQKAKKNPGLSFFPR